MLKALTKIFYLELCLRLRHSHEWLYPLNFFLIVIILFPIAITHDPAMLKQIMPGCLWIAALLASLLGIANIFVTDLEDRNADQQLLSPIPLFMLMLIKVTAVWLTTELPLILITPLLCWIFQMSFDSIMTLIVTLLLGTPILCLIGALGAALTQNTKQESILLGILILPLCIPVLIFGVNLVTEHERGFAISGPLAILAALLFFAILTLPVATAAALRISLDD